MYPLFGKLNPAITTKTNANKAKNKNWSNIAEIPSPRKRFKYAVMLAPFGVKFPMNCIDSEKSPIGKKLPPKKAIIETTIEEK